jgi:hypothetical protein
MTYINACLGYLYDMIDLLKQYVDSGNILNSYQLGKLPRNLFNTYIRKMLQKDWHYFYLRDLDVIYNKADYLDDKVLNNLFKHRQINIKDFEKPSERVQIAAVSNDMNAISNIIKDKGIKPSEKVQLAAVKYWVGAIIDMVILKIEPSEDVQIAAINENPEIISVINNSTEKVQTLAILKNPNLFKKIKNPYPSVINLYKELTND